VSLRFRNGRYEIDFYPDGRNGKRIQRILAPGIDTDEAEEPIASIRRNTKSVQVSPRISGLPCPG